MPPHMLWPLAPAMPQKEQESLRVSLPKLAIECSQMQVLESLFWSERARNLPAEKLVENMGFGCGT